MIQNNHEWIQQSLAAMKMVEDECDSKPRLAKWEVVERPHVYRGQRVPGALVLKACNCEALVLITEALGATPRVCFRVPAFSIITKDKMANADTAKYLVRAFEM